jgi:biotin carboxyl carrier protein
MKYIANVEGRQVEIDFQTHGDAIEATIDGRTYVVEATAVEDGVYWFNLGNRSVEVAVTPAGDLYNVAIGGQQIDVEIMDTRAALKKAAQHGQAGVVELKAPMPGKIVKVLVAEGAEVSANQGILVMEAMKMQNEIKAPKKGIVKKIAVREGLAVNSGDLLAAVE